MTVFGLLILILIIFLPLILVGTPLMCVSISAVASIFALFNWRKCAISFGCIASSVWAAYILVLIFGASEGRLTLLHTRLLYSALSTLAGLFTYIRWRYKWIMSYSTVLSAVFVLLSIFKPEVHSQTLAPALQSPWFIPHVTVYMFSYSLLGCAFLIGLVGLIRRDGSCQMLSSADTLTYIGLAFMTFGMLSGAIWAKDAWGHYWSWDPKETWALITWVIYVLYIHLRLYRKGGYVVWYILLIFAFACLQMCWWGVNLLPSAQNSMHVY